MSEQDEQTKARRSNLPLLLRELLAAAIGAAVFLYLIFCPGKLGDLEQWDASTVALFADAATVAGIVTVPLALLFGGADLIALIVRIVARALKDRERRSLELRLKLPRVASAPRRTVGASRARPMSGCVLIAIVAAVVVWLMTWFGPTAWRTLNDWWSQAGVASSDSQDDPIVDSFPDAGPTGDFPTYCGLEAGRPVCAANALAPSPEALGLAVCNRAGLGWPIFRANREERGYTFDPYHVPPGTRFTVRCPKI